jgi:hypothetical protein
MKRKTLVWGALLALGALVALIVATGAFGFDSGGNPGTTGDKTITWTGQGANNGVLNTEECDAANDPNGANQPYLLWILTVDGGSIQSDDTTPTLHLGGTGSGAYQTQNPSDNSSAHFVTPYFTPDSNLTAYAEMIVTDPGTGSWILTISHGCSGSGRTPADHPTVNKDAPGSYDNTIGWSIDKSADTGTVYSAGGGESGPVNYTVTVSHDTGTPSNVKVAGTITASNPGTNAGSVTLSGVTDNIVDGSNNVVQGCSVDTSAPGALTIAAGGTQSYLYSCSLGDSLPTGDVFNYVQITWDGQNVGTTQHLNAGSADFTTPSAIDFTANTINNCVQVTDTLDGTPGTLGVACADGTFTPDAGAPTDLSSSYDTPTGTFTLTYSRTFTGDPAGTCTGHSNTASVGTVPSDGGLSVALAPATDPVKVKDCQGADLTVKKTASGSFNRDYDWSVLKSQTTSSTPINSSTSSVTVGYKVTATWSGPTDSGWQVIGTITVHNPNDWESVTLTGVTDAIDNGGTCTVSGNTGQTIAANGDSTGLTYTCTYASAPSPAAGTNTATATWDPTAASTPDGTASGPAGVDFSTVTPTVTHNTTTVKDTFNGGTALTLGVANVNGTFTKNAGNNLANWTQSYDLPSKTFTFTYTRSVTVVPNTCTTYNNTATVSADATSGDNSSNASVTVCGRVTGGLTIGFWSNNNGKAVLCAHDPAWRQLLNGTAATAPYNAGSYLRNANGSFYTVPTGSCNSADSSFSNWLLNANSTNASYMLSAQLAGTILDVNYNGMNGNACIAGIGGSPITINNLIAAVITFLKANGNTTAAGPARTLAVNYQTILNNLNNGQAFAVSGC